MKRALYSGLCGVLLLSLPVQAEPSGWKLVFEDNFNGSRLDNAKWSTTYPWGARTNPPNKEAEYYADDAFDVHDGILSIRAQHRAMGGFQYTSGMISSYGKFSQKYGYFEMRAKLPAGQGFWPAFWLLPDTKTWPPEIDIFENLGQQPEKIFMTNHFGKDNKQVQGTDVSTSPDFSQGFHTYGLLWQPDLLVWYIDGQERFRTTSGVPQEPMYMIANLAVGGSWGGYPDKNTVFPNSMDIDYIRAYSMQTNP